MNANLTFLANDLDLIVEVWLRMVYGEADVEHFINIVHDDELGISSSSCVEHETMSFI